MLRQKKPASLAGKFRVLPWLLPLCLVAGPGRAGENRDGVQPDTPLMSPTGVMSDAERMDRFVIFNEKLKSAVCDENYISKAPTLDSITSAEDRAVSEFDVPLAARLPEAEVISFLLGDSLAGMYSESVDQQIKEALKSRGLGEAPKASVLSGELFLDAQSAVVAVKRKASQEICEAMVNFSRLRQLLNARPSRFIEARPRGVAGNPDKAKGFRAEVIDSGGRFGRFGERSSGRATAKYLIPGWLESFEIAKVAVLDARGAQQRSYRRIANPVTNNTQSIELMSREGVPLGVLFLSREPAAGDWAVYRNWAELPEARIKQIETYRSRIETEALQRIQGNSGMRDQVRNLQEFYKNLLQAYQLFPNEKQFETYGKGAQKKASLDEITRNLLGSGFLEQLQRARVNGSFVHVGLFYPDPKLHAIYTEYSQRLAKLGSR